MIAIVDKFCATSKLFVRLQKHMCLHPPIFRQGCSFTAKRHSRWYTSEEHGHFETSRPLYLRWRISWFI